MNRIRSVLESFDLGKAHINRLNVRSICPDPSNLERVINLIILIYNKTKNEHEDAQYQRVPLSDDFALSGFSTIQIYYAKPVQPLNKLGRLLGKVGCTVDFSTTGLDFLFFLGKGEDLYALTSNHSWKVIKKYSDCHFPIAIARKLTSPSFVYRETKPLVGNIASKADAYKVFQAQQHQLQNIWLIFKCFETTLKKNCSLFSLPPFAKFKDEKIAVSIGVGQLSFGLNLTLPHLCQTLDHLSKIYRGEETKQLNGEVETNDPNYRFLDYIQPVKNGFHKTLNEELLDKVWKFFANQIPFVDFFFCHRYSIDFCRSKEFKLVYWKDDAAVWDKTWHAPPSFFDVIHELQKHLKGVGTKKEFTNHLSHLYLKFEKKEPVYHLTDFFQGEIRSAEGTYFRVEGVWYEVKADYLIIVQRNFYHLLQNHLIKKGERGSLPKSWFRREEWTSFTAAEAAAAAQISSVTALDHLSKLANTDYSVVDEGGKVMYPHAGHNLINRDITHDKLAEVDLLLQSKAKITQDDLVNIGFKNKSGRVLEHLQKARKVVKTSKKQHWIACGPPPESSPLKAFLLEKNREFLQVGIEEQYNRSYLDEEGFLVADQVYPSEIERVEMWDLLYHADPNHLFLYQVKGGFCQDTRDACSQIRLAAQNLRADLSAKDCPLLSRLYRVAAEAPPSSLFRKKVAQTFKKFSQEEFINLFLTKDRKIVFVYAVLDDTDGIERLLSDEPNIEEPFTRNDFANWPQKTIESLKSSGYLSDEMQITAKFLRCNEKEFCKDKAVLGLDKDKEKLYRLLNQRDTNFNSIIAKLELINLHYELEKCGFSFKIAQISRGKAAVSRERNEKTPRMPLQMSLLNFLKPAASKKRQRETDGGPGIKNLRTDCFLISALQLLIHSDFYPLLTDQRRIEDGKEWFTEFSQFSQAYSEGSDTLTVNQLRSSLNFSQNDQEDAAEAITRIFGKYNLDFFASRFKYVRQIKWENVTSMENSNNQFSLLNQDNVMEIETALPLIPMELRAGTFQSLLDQFFQVKNIDAPFTFAVEPDKLYQANSFEEKLVPVALKDTLIISFNRFDQENKLEDEIDFEVGSCQIGDKKYELKGFIVHIGAAKNAGHYMAYCKKMDAWYRYNDEDVGAREEKDALQRAAKAYIVLLSAV
jgi:Ubiquitin carboxyl-terminal hydrolase